MQSQGPFCQSCGMPMQSDDSFGTEEDGSRSEKFCHYCYKNGEFIQDDITMEQMIDISAKGWSDQDPSITFEKAKAQMSKFLPMLERWRD